ncbi:MAG: RHS repeat-associated core domain-containing protein [Bacteroidota bacterium]
MSNHRLVLRMGLMVYCGLVIGILNGYGQPLPAPGIQSPTAASLAKAIDANVSMYTGQASYSIPLTSIGNYGFSLEYSYSGLKPAEIPGMTGLGWNMSGLGVITRSVRSLKDEEGGGYARISDSLQANHKIASPTFINEMNSGIWDAQPDIFFYNFGGYSGKFYFDMYGEVRVEGDVQLKITPTLNTGQGRFTEFEIIDPSGNIYTFGTGDIVEVTRSETRVNSSSANTREYDTSWYLAKIEYTSGQQVDFTYTTVSTLCDSGSDWIDRRTSAEKVVNSANMNPYQQTEVRDCYKKRLYLSSASFHDHQIDFNYNLTRTDFTTEKALTGIEHSVSGNLRHKVAFTYGYLDTNARLILKELDVQSSTGSDVMNWKFSYHSETAYIPAITTYQTDHWGFYNGVSDNDSTGEKLSRYYIKNPNHDTYSPSTHGLNRDPNSVTSRIGMLESIQIPSGGTTTLEYEPNTYSKVGSVANPVHIQEVSYLGGLLEEDDKSKTEVISPTFTLAPASGGTVPLDVYLLGAEIDTTAQACASASTIIASGVHIYLEGVGHSYSQELNIDPNPGDYCTVPYGGAYPGPGDYRVRTVLPSNYNQQQNPLFSVALRKIIGVVAKEIQGPGHRIKRVTSSDGIISTADTQTEYRYSSFSDTSSSSGALSRPYSYWYQLNYSHGGDYLEYWYLDGFVPTPTQGPVLGYSNIEVIEQSGTDQIRTRHYFSNSDGVTSDNPVTVNTGSNTYNDIGESNILPIASWTNYGFARGRLLRTEQYNTSDQLMQVVGYEYNQQSKKALNDSYGSIPLNMSVPEFQFYDLNPHMSVIVPLYNSSSYRIPVWTYPKKDTTYWYEGGSTNPPTQVTLYNHDVLTTMPIGNTTYNSLTSELRRTKITYAYEIYNGAGQMKDKNMLTQKYAEVLDEGSASTDLSKSWTTWSNASGAWRPDQQWTWKGTGTAPATPSTSNSVKISDVLTYDAYGNIMEVEDAAGVVSSFHYDNTGTQVVGAFSNTPQNDIDVVYMGDDYQSSYGPLPNGLVSYKNGNGTLTYSMGEENQVPHLRVEIDNLTSGGAGARVSVGPQPVGKQFRLDIEYKVTEGVFHVKGFNSATSTHTNWITSGVTSGWVKTSVDIVTATDGHLYLRAPWNGTGAPNTTFYLRHIRIYPVEAQAQSANYHATFQTPVYVMDQSGSAVTYEYDGAGRLNGMRNTNGYQTTAYSYGYSAAKNGGVYDPLAPNTVESITYLDPFMYDDFSSSANWTSVNPTYNEFNVQMAGETTVRMGSGGSYEGMYVDLGNEEIVARIDFYPDNTTGGTPHIMLSGPGNRFAVHYQYSSDRFRIQYQKDSGSYQYPFTFPLSATIDRWYTIELSKKEGTLTAWVYPKGEGRDPDNSYTLNGFSTTWTPNFALSGNDSYYYVANLSIAKSWQAGMEYLDGLGRSIQSQMRDAANTAIITDTRYNERGLPEVASRPIELTGVTNYQQDLMEGTGSFNPGGVLHSTSDVEDYYDPLVASGTEDYAYTYTQYEDTPQARVKEQRLPGGASYDVQISYGLNTTETFATAAQGSTPAKTWATNTLTKTVTTDPDNKRTITYTDGWGQTIASGVDMNGDSKLTRSSTDLVTEFAYDLRGNLVRVEDPKGLATTYTYNTLGQLTEKKLPDQTQSNKYTYDDKGRLRFFKDPASSTTPCYYTKYDDLDRPVEAGQYTSYCYFFNDATKANDATWPTSSTAVNITYSYDGDDAYSGTYSLTSNNQKGRLSRVRYRDPNTGNLGYTWYSYNNLGLVEWVGQQLPGSTVLYYITYIYDELGRLTQRSITPLGSSDPNDREWYQWQEYDSFGRLHKVYSNTSSSTGSRTLEAEYTYTADGQVKQTKLGPNPVQTVDYTYTVQGWMDKINNASTSSATYGDRFGLNLDYNLNGNISTQQFRQQGATNTNLLTYSYGYDTANRLASAGFTGTGYGGDAYDVTYAYDDNGNFTGITRKNESGSAHLSPTAFTYVSGTNKIDRVSVYMTHYTAQHDLYYDANGNVEDNEAGDYYFAAYDWRNLMTEVGKGGSSVYFAYDADGNRISKRLSAYQVSEDMQYIRGANGEVVAVYLNGNLQYHNTLAGGDMIGNYDGSQRRYFLKDHLGSVRTTVDQNGNVDGYDDYYAFGLTMPGRSSNSANPNDDYKFTGHERDEEAGLNLIHAGARMMDPVIGRWLGIDPLSAKFPEHSPYNYVINNPLIYFDPKGEEWFYYQADDEDEKRWHYHEDTSEMEVWTGTYDDDGNKVMETQQGMIELLSYDGEALRWHRDDGTSLVAFGVSGEIGEDGTTNPDNQWVENVGPIPEGWYIAFPNMIQDWENLSLKQKLYSLARRGQWPGGTTAWGKTRLFLDPDKVGNRSNFSIHGGLFPGSRGCIDLCSDAPYFFNAFRNHYKQVGLHVNYNKLRNRKK